jgi:hypothetical protein
MNINPFSALSTLIPSVAMQVYVGVMIFLVVAGTIFDVIHKRSARYFFEGGERFKPARTREVSGGEKVSIAIATAAVDVLASGEFCNTRRRLAHLLTMYGLVLFLIGAVVMVYGYSGPGVATPIIWPLLWYIGAAMVMVGGYWFWFRIRVDVAAEGHKWYQVAQADLFILSLLATTTFAFIWSWVEIGAGAGVTSMIFFGFFILSATVLFAGVPWSKFAHMFFKPAAAFQRRVNDADGSRENLPPPADKPEQFGLGIRREAPRHY